MSMLNNVVGYWVYIWRGVYTRGSYILNDVSISTCDWLTHKGAYIRSEGLYSEVWGIQTKVDSTFKSKGAISGNV